MNFVSQTYVKNLDLKNFKVSELESNLLSTEKVFIGVKAEPSIKGKFVDISTILKVKETVRNFYTELVLQILVQRFDFDREDIKSLIMITQTLCL